MSKPLYYGWILLGVLWLVFAFNLGFPAYGGPVLNSAMAKELGFSRETLGLITTFYIIMSGLPGPVVAMAVNRFGVRRTLIAGSLMNVTGALFMATVANSGAAAYLGFGLVVGGGVCTGAAIASQTALSRWFVRRRSMALSILYSSGAIGGFFAVKFILPWAMSERRQLARRVVGHRCAVRRRGRAGAAVRARAARGHGPAAGRRRRRARATPRRRHGRPSSPPRPGSPARS